MTDTILLDTGMKILTEHLGLVEAERFICLMNKERFDYTQWHGVLSEGKTVEEISAEAMKLREEKKASRKPDAAAQPFDYTKFRHSLFEGMSIEDIHREAARAKREADERALANERND